MKILAIETSCDETAIAILETPTLKLLSNVVLSQIKIHKPFGGVVPNLAKREHQKNLVPILLRVLNNLTPLLRKERGGEKRLCLFSQERLQKILAREPELLKIFRKKILPLKAPNIDVIAVTNGPGLEPALWVGINFAKALSEIWKIPIIPVNHLEGHIYASWLNVKPRRFDIPKFPLLALIVSGGHTEIVLMKQNQNYKILGETRDDAAGEAFDKVAKMLGLGYPGGPLISKLAGSENSNAINFPRPMINSPDFDFSFSGLKTAVLYFLKDNPKANKTVVAAGFQQAVVDVLVAKTVKALKKYKIKSLIVGGGVAANKLLRKTLEEKIKKEFPNVSLFLSPISLTGDNAAMIASAAHFKFIKYGERVFRKAENIRAHGNLRLGKE